MVSEPDLAQPDRSERARSDADTIGRRDRALDRGEDVLLATVAQKILHGWLQNRHQTLYPLTVNLGTLDAARRESLAQLMAISALAAPGGPGDRITPIQEWLISVGADRQMLATFDAALAAPPSVSSVIDAILQHRLGAYAYILALKAVDPHHLSSGHFLDYLGERLALPTTVMRSATRRYRQ